ncbi:MAG: hypothetical protein P9L92_08155 [Candidatus Electryonea clarkiae]|nr:hypothetical protein [Candidatus Electryonea clarkiae]MDP8285603.1 hypothetical protein [Candidatus Electryonea clarkiae]
MRKSLNLFALICSIFIGSTAYSQQGGVILVSHIPIVFAEAGEPIEINATLDGDVTNDQVVEAYIWYRNRDQEAFDFAEMIPGMENFTGEIPGEHISAVGIEYYLEFKLNDGRKTTFPSALPEANPVVVSVRGTSPGETISAVLIISPEPESMVPEEDLLVAVAFDQSVRTIDPSKVVLRIDGIDRTHTAAVTEDVLTAIAGNIRPGRHRIDIVSEEETGSVLLETWYFSVRSERERMSARTGIRGNIRGTAEFVGSMQRFSSLEQQVAHENLSIRGKFGNFSALAMARLKSEEQGNLQPQHRFKVSLGMPWWRIRAGDINPRYNELVLYGRRVRGAELNLLTGPFNVYLISGDINRAVEGRHAGVSVDTTDIMNPDTTQIYTPGTYRRTLNAVRITFGAQDRLMFGIIAMKAKDDKESLDSTKSRDFGAPKDNLVNGYSLEGFFHRKRISLKGEAAISLYNGNTLSPPLADAADFKDIIWINQYFEPLPDEGLPTSDGTESTSLDMQQVAMSIINNALSYQTRLRLRYFKNDLSLGYRLINQSYISLGSPSLLKNDAGWFVRDRIRLMQSRLYLNMGYQSYHDNLSGAGITSRRNNLNVGFSLFTGVKYPDLTVNYRNAINKNDGEFTSTVDDPTLPDDVDTRISNTNNMVNVNLSHNLLFAGTRNNFNLGVMTSVRDDQFNELGGQDQLMLAFGVASEFEFPLVIRANVSNASQQSVGGLTDVSYTTIFLRGDYRFLNNSLVPYFGPKITLGSGEYTLMPDDPGTAELREQTVRHQVLDFTRIDWISGAEYRFMKVHSLSGFVSFTSYIENGKFEYWNGAVFDMTEESIDNGSSSNIVQRQYDRDDYQMSIRYTYRF